MSVVQGLGIGNIAIRIAINIVFGKLERFLEDN
jgi:hypothetical protein